MQIGKKYKALTKLTLENFNSNLTETERLSKLYEATNNLVTNYYLNFLVNIL